ncbi:M24 family metallopeptidase [[Clostridium] hylemonae]|uniref:Creatinase n=1 Tax=[Clostridium] hylemonae DSM 15053 TaxID=553973 RepID=C0C1H9_9FIRM|nr:M24 family metallopeptidase [[Clostridium] hylemonae]EEG73993.1 hypothetical protein CLOHYLEM_05999 [[Clostridium] hylemonae DSM 15053]QEK19382.1 putative peptidase [[Clostridium] hylemonae DSM 15053]
MTDFEIKLERIRHLLDRRQADALVIARRDNFAWLTGGEESGVILNQETGFVYLVVTRKELTAAALWADAAKAKEELLAGLGFTVHTLNWKQPGKEQYIERLLKGKKALSDIPLEGCLCDTEAVYELEYPMTETEIERYRELGRLSDRILADTAGNIKRGMTEQEIKAELLRQCADRGVETDVLLVGADERIEKYRHCTPTEKAAEHTALLSPVLRRYGLHSNIARMVCFGSVPEEVREKYDAVCQIQAEIISMSREGIPFGEIFQMQERSYRQLGYGQEWMRHGHGAPVGYMLSDASVLYNSGRRMMPGQAYEWYVTVSGAKSAELVMNTGGRQEILSMTGLWPEKEYRTSNGDVIKLPDIWII